MHYTDLSGFAYNAEHGGLSSNLEFRFSGPGSIPNSVQQYNVMRGAELAELRRRRERTPGYPLFCKVRCPGSDVNSMVKSRDLDVVTQLSLDSKTKIRDEGEADEADEEGSEWDYKAADSVRLCGGADIPQAKGKGKSSRIRKMKVPAVKSARKHQQQHPHPRRRLPGQKNDILDKLKNLHLEVCAELQNLVQEEEAILCPSLEPSPAPSPSSSPRRPKKVKQRRMQQQLREEKPRQEEKPRRIKREQTAKRQEEKQPRRIQREQQEYQPIQRQEVKPPPQELYQRSGDQVSYEDYYQPQPKWVDIMPSAMMSQGIKVNVCTCPAATPQSAMKFMEQYGSLEPESLNPFFQEDSDLDHEFADRKGYLRYVEPRPLVDEESTDSDLVPADHRRSPDPCQPLAGKPCFIELEQRPHQVSLLRSLSPMRYTSQGSELVVEKPPPAPAPSQIEVPPLDLQAKKKTKKTPKAKSEKAPKSAKSKAAPAKVVQPRWRAVKAGKVEEEKARLPAGSQPVPAALQPAKNPAKSPSKTPSKNPSKSPSKNPSTTNPAQPPQPPATVGTPTPKRPKKPKPGKKDPPVVYSKSLEELKCEKLRIYNKISFTQERVISALDKLQINLIQLPAAAHKNVQERQKRQRNAFEFCVRFARNFLYPLKGMIDDVRITSVANFNSAISNEASHRVMCVYGLMLQSIQTYQRQLRYFLLEKVAQKLSALIEMIYTMTNCCLDKNILDRNDPVVECLLERCTRFLSFIEDMQEERFKLARESFRRKHKHPMHQAHQVHPAPVARSPRSQRGAKSSFNSPRQLGPAPVLPQPKLARLPKAEKQCSHDRYDLKMYLNDFKVYEPRVVPKEPKVASHRRRRRFRQRRNSMTPALQMVAGSPIVDMPSDAELMAAKSEVRTQMQIQAEAGVDGVSTNSSLSLPAAGGGDLGSSPREAMMEAVRRVTRNQLEQVLDPMMRSLSAMLNEKIARMGGQVG